MSTTEDKKKVPLIALSILITIPVTITITYGALGAGWFDFLLPQGEFPLINGTLVGTDNKTYGILLSSSEQKPNLTSINSAVLDSNNKTFHIQISSKVTTPPIPPVEPPEPPVCQPGYHLENGVCVPDVVIPPTPTVGELKVIITADVEDTNAGNAVFNRIKQENPTNVFVLGDLGYESSLSWFKSTYGTLGNKVNCVAGNHEWANEDGTSSLQTETSNYCGASSWYLKKGPTVFFGYNSNGDLTGQATSIGKLLQSSSFMQGVKSVHIMGHKGCAVPPGSHHGVEISSFCTAIAGSIPSTVKAYYDSGHNHVLSQSADLKYKQSGAGGRSHYECTSTTAWWCDNSHYGFLVYTIKPDGTTTHQFKDYNGVVLK